MRKILSLLAAASLLLGASTASAAPNYGQIKTSNANFIASAQVPTAAGRASSGAIAIHPSGTVRRILPYDANLAAKGMLSAGSSYCSKVAAWADWYVRHVNWPDRWNLYASVYDWQVDTNTWTESQILTNGLPNYDSADSYSATFMSLMKAYALKCGTSATTWIKNNKYVINSIGHVMTDPLVLSSSGLTWAKPDYHVLFNMDNSESYAGLVDAAWVATNVWADSAEASWYNSKAATLKANYDGQLWLSSQSAYSPARPDPGTPDPQTWTRLFPDSTTQVFPFRFGVISATSTRANNLWASLNLNWPTWTGCQLIGPGGQAEPFSELGHAAAVRNDKLNGDAYLTNCANRWTGFPWPYHVRHAGLMIETAARWG